MPVVSIPGNSDLKLKFQTGVDGSGNPVYRRKTFNNVKAGTTDQDVYDVAVAIADLQEYTLAAVERANNSELTNA